MPDAHVTDHDYPTSVKILFVHTYYPQFLKDLYGRNNQLAACDYDTQLAGIFDEMFSVADAHSHGIEKTGAQAKEVICNADPLQGAWAKSHDMAAVENIHDRRRQVLAAQIDDYRPDVLYIFEWSPLGDAFLAEIKDRVRLLVGQIASPLPDNRTFAAYDVMVSSYPPIVDHFNAHGARGIYLPLAFDTRVLEKIVPAPPRHDVTFVGGFAPSHPDRAEWLETLLSRVDVAIFGYGIERVPPDSPIHAHYHAEQWGLSMYETLQRSRITLNLHAHIEVDNHVSRRFANNMRLYEATGVGTCLVTEDRENVQDFFEPGAEVATFSSFQDCVDTVERLLQDEPARKKIAAAGQRRTLAEHTYPQRMSQLADILRERLRS